MLDHPHIAALRDVYETESEIATSLKQRMVGCVGGGWMGLFFWGVLIQNPPFWGPCASPFGSLLVVNLSKKKKSARGPGVANFW